MRSDAGEVNNRGSVTPPPPPERPALPTATRLALEAAGRLGYRAEVLDPAFGYLYALTGPNGTRTFLGGRSPLNDAVAARLAEDKHYSGLLLRRAGLRTPPTARCLSPSHPSLSRYRDRAGAGPALELAARLGYPLVVKPNRLSHGRGVRLVTDDAGLLEAVESAWALDAIALVQEHVPGRDLRVDLIDGSFLLGYERVPLALRPDGAATVDVLLARADPRLEDPGARRRLLEDPTVRSRLASWGWTGATVPATGEVRSFDTGLLNLNGPATARVLTDLPASWAAWGARVAAALGLRHLGIDLRVADPASDPETATVLEVNASPLLSQVYLLGHREAAIRAQMRVLRAAMEDGLNEASSPGGGRG
ncbi:MAG: hypothetical protein ACFCGT_13635 [Sandaracinaceae bacterium]